MMEAQGYRDEGVTGKGGFRDESKVKDRGSGGMEEAEAAALRGITCILLLNIIKPCLYTAWGNEGGE